METTHAWYTATVLTICLAVALFGVTALRAPFTWHGWTGSKPFWWTIITVGVIGAVVMAIVLFGTEPIAGL